MTIDEILRSGKKIITAGLIAGAMLLTPKTAKAEDTGFFWEVDGGIHYEQTLVKKIENVPSNIREVKIHPDDSYAREENNAPIEDDDLSMCDRISIPTLRGGLGFNLNDTVALAAGLNLDINGPASGGSWKEGNKKDMHSRNYTNDPGDNTRGTGAALIYYTANQTYLWDSNTFVRPALFTELDFMNKDKGIMGAVGCKLYQMNITAENGWDRYDKLESNDKFDLASLTVAMPYVSARIIFAEDESENSMMYLSLDGGLQAIVNKSESDYGKAADINYNNPAWFAGLSVGARF